MKVIITGFQPFGSHKHNPSQEAVQALPESVKFNDNSATARVAKLILPVCCLEAFQVLSPLVAESLNEPFALILCGLSYPRNIISLERFALNVRDFRMPDNNGHNLDEEYIIPEGPEALRSKVPLIELNDEINRSGYACEISNHAGTFVCNETYYRSLFSWQEHNNCRGILFVHVPPYESYLSGNLSENDTAQVRRIYTEVLSKIAGYLARQTAPLNTCKSA